MCAKVIGWVTQIYYFELLRASEGMLSCWSRLHLQPLAPSNPQWARVVGFGPFLMCNKQRAKTHKAHKDSEKYFTTAAFLWQLLGYVVDGICPSVRKPNC
jgi:hypothetical protein